MKQGAGYTAQLIENSPSMYKAYGLTPSTKQTTSTDKLPIYNASTYSGKQRCFQDHPQLHSKFKASLRHKTVSKQETNK